MSSSSSSTPNTNISTSAPKPQSKESEISSHQSVVYSEKEVKSAFGDDMLVDCIVIGSGVSGLVTASLLAQSGLKTAVLERHAIAGGATQVFEEQGFRFEMGLQDVGAEMWKGDDAMHPAPHVLNAATGEPRVEWETQGDIYHEIVRHDKRMPVPSGREKWRQQLLQSFPKESASIDRYFEAVEQTRAESIGYLFSRLPRQPDPIVNASTGLIGKLLGHGKHQPSAGARQFAEKASKTVDEVLEKLIPNDAKLRYILSYAWAKVGLPPHAASWGAYCVVVGSYLEGACYPKGGVGTIADKLIRNIEKHGGKVFVKAPVNGLVVENQECVGVKVENSAPIRVNKAVVSAVGAWNTYNYLIPSDLESLVETPKEALEELQWSTYAVLQVFVGLRGSGEELNLPSSSIWFVPDTMDHTENAVNYFLDSSMEVDFPFLHMSFPSMKDPEWEKHYPGKSTCVMYAGARYEWFKDLSDDVLKNLSEAIVQRMLKKLLQQLPHLKDHVEVLQLATPLAHEFHLGARKGGQFGLGHTPHRFEQEWLRPQTPVKGLFMAGQDLFTCGVPFAIMSGYMGAAAVSDVAMNKFKHCFFPQLTKEKNSSKEKEGKKAGSTAKA